MEESIVTKAKTFEKLNAEVTDYLSEKEIYVRDAFVRANPEYRMNARTISEYSWPSLFVKNMFLRLEDGEYEELNEERLILCAPRYEAKHPESYGIRVGNFSILDYTQKMALIGRSAYTGEIEKGTFSTLKLILPTENNVLPIHCSANTGETGILPHFWTLRNGNDHPFR